MDLMLIKHNIEKIHQDFELKHLNRGFERMFVYWNEERFKGFNRISHFLIDICDLRFDIFDFINRIFLSGEILSSIHLDPIFLVMLEYMMLFGNVDDNHPWPLADSDYEIFLPIRDSIIEEIKFGRTASLIALFKAKCSHIPLWQEYEKELTKVLNYVPEKIHIIDLANDLDSINSGTCPNIILLAFEHFDSEPLQSLLQNDYIRHLRIDEDEDEEEESDVPIEWKLRMDQKIIANRAHHTITMALLCAEKRIPSMRTSCWLWQDIHKYLLY